MDQFAERRDCQLQVELLFSYIQVKYPVFALDKLRLTSSNGRTTENRTLENNTFLFFIACGSFSNLRNLEIGNDELVNMRGCSNFALNSLHCLKLSEIKEPDLVNPFLYRLHADRLQTLEMSGLYATLNLNKFTELKEFKIEIHLHRQEDTVKKVRLPASIKVLKVHYKNDFIFCPWLDDLIRSSKRTKMRLEHLSIHQHSELDLDLRVRMFRKLKELEVSNCDLRYFCKSPDRIHNVRWSKNAVGVFYRGWDRIYDKKFRKIRYDGKYVQVIELEDE